MAGADATNAGAAEENERNAAKEQTLGGRRTITKGPYRIMLKYFSIKPGFAKGIPVF